ncbi:unnamed protein product [Amoebophrya sp. A25]|nr:unnamed protein product [Amoebophrya sp. A25]|eukprot:GSA25T00025992001.1
MAPVTSRDLLGVHQVHVDGAHWFNVRCAEVPGVSLTSKLAYNCCSSPLEFEFLPKPGQRKLPTWVSDTRPVKKTKIHRWGKPYTGAFTCEVDGDAYCAFKTSKSSKQIDWRMPADFEEICIWKQGTQKDKDDAAKKCWKKSAKSWEWVPKDGGKAPVMKRVVMQMKSKKVVKKSGGK